MRRASKPTGELARFGYVRFSAQAAGKWCAENTPGGKI